MSNKQHIFLPTNKPSQEIVSNRKGLQSSFIARNGMKKMTHTITGQLAVLQIQLSQGRTWFICFVEKGNQTPETQIKVRNLKYIFEYTQIDNQSTTYMIPPSSMGLSLKSRSFKLGM